MKYDNIYICFAGQSWDTPLKTNRHYMMDRFAKKNMVLFIESMGLRMPTVSKNDIFKILTKIFRSLLGARKTSNKNLYALDPIIFPVAISNQFSILSMVNRILLNFQVKRALKKIKKNKGIIEDIKIVLWSYVPTVVPFIGSYKEELLVYDCVDDCSGVKNFSKTIDYQDQKLTESSDVIFALSKPIFKQKSKINKNVHYAPGAADNQLFGLAMRASTKIPDDVSSIPRPILGYIGNLADHKQDFKLVEYIAKQRDNYSIVIIGPKWPGDSKLDSDIDKLEKMKNIHFLGLKNHNDLPSYIKSFSVCILPQKSNKYSRSSFPMKLYEYLGSGKPVVSTHTETLVEFKDYIWLADSYNDFLKGIDYYLNSDDTNKRNKRLELAKYNNWDRRFKLLEREVNRILIN